MPRETHWPWILYQLIVAFFSSGYGIHLLLEEGVDLSVALGGTFLVLCAGEVVLPALFVAGVSLSVVIVLLAIRGYTKLAG